MPYRNTRPRQRRRQTSWQKGAYAGKRQRKRYARAPFSAIQRDVAYLKNLINVEFKAVDTAGTTNASDTGTRLLLNGVATGDDYNDRDGRQLRFKSLQSSLTITKNASATNTQFRALWVIDKQPNQVALTVADVLDISVAPPHDAFRNLDERKRFVILRDVTRTLTADRPEANVRLYRRMDMKTVYDGPTNGVADITTNSLYLILLSDETTQQPAVQYNNRLRFIDN